MIEIRHWFISPYAICFAGAFVLGYLYVATALSRRGMAINYIFYSVMINICMVLYGGLLFTFVTRLIRGEDVRSYGFSSIGGALGMMLGVFIFNRIYAEYKADVRQTYMKSLGLFYGISKLGCAFAGCCRGISYSGILSVTYVDGSSIAGPYFPVQLLESEAFLIAFVLIAVMSRRYSKYVAAGSVLIYAILKFALDYLRWYDERGIVTANQAVCILIAGGAVVYIYKNARIVFKET